MNKITSIVTKVKAGFSGLSCKAFAAPAAISATATTLLMSASASEPQVAITTEMLTPVVDQVVANIGVAMPVGLTIFGILAGITICLRTIRSFLHG